MTGHKCAASRDWRNRSGGSGRTGGRIRRTCDDIRRRRSTGRQSRTRLARPQVHLRCGVALPGLSPCLFSRTTPDHGGTLAASPQSLSVSVSQWPHGEEWSNANPDLHDREPRMRRTLIRECSLRKGTAAYAGLVGPHDEQRGAFKLDNFPVGPANPAFGVASAPSLRHSWASRTCGK